MKVITEERAAILRLSFTQRCIDLSYAWNLFIKQVREREMGRQNIIITFLYLFIKLFLWSLSCLEVWFFGYLINRVVIHDSSILEVIDLYFYPQNMFAIWEKSRWDSHLKWMVQQAVTPYQCVVSEVALLHDGGCFYSLSSSYLKKLSASSNIWGCASCKELKLSYFFSHIDLYWALCVKLYW